MDNEDWLGAAFITGIICLVLGMFLGVWIADSDGDAIISGNALDGMCKQLTNDSAALYLEVNTLGIDVDFICETETQEIVYYEKPPLPEDKDGEFVKPRVYANKTKGDDKK